MEVTKNQLGIINAIIQVDNEGKAKQYGLADLSTAHDIFKEIKKSTEGNIFIDGEVEFTSEQKVFLTKLIDERTWSVVDAETVFELKALFK